jgi:hypothetical protein
MGREHLRKVDANRSHEPPPVWFWTAAGSEAVGRANNAAFLSGAGAFQGIADLLKAPSPLRSAGAVQNIME